ncbi:YccT family protein [Marinomonas colpomeniae]|uniref:DUF2057 domain-containing protein n=1 Tax=Marinomonas colpomeniae TaxID=2774408 RepID=A0ABR8P1Z5_9GAMM|nr:DUF2057 domain-containing protein [Marinomonas colpomeniae]MBD5772295.1 DUF2057 domain-containing protein [Marinomonas colpomeniae]
MSLKKRLIEYCVLFSSMLVVPIQAATFEVPRSFEIMYVDLEGTGKFGNDFKIEVSAGAHQIVIRFNKLLRSGGDTEVYQSEPIVLDLVFEKDVSLIIKAPYISNQKQAESYLKAPKYTISDKLSGKSVEYQQHILPTQSGLQNTRDYVDEIEQLTSETRPKNHTYIDKNIAFSERPFTAPLIMSDDMSLDMMKFWYNQSDEVTRKELRIWISDALYQSKLSSIQFEMSQLWYTKANSSEQEAFELWFTH